MPKLLSKNLMMDKQILLGILMGTSRPILVLDKEARIISISQKAKDTFRYHEGFLFGKNITDIIEPSYHSSLNTILSSSTNIPDDITYRFECEFLGESEALYPVELSIYKMIQGEDINYIILIKEQNHKLAIANYGNQGLQMFQLVAESSSSLIIVDDFEGIISYVNPKIQEFLGFNREEVIGKNFNDLVHPDDVEVIKGLHPETQNSPIRVKDSEGNYQSFLFVVQNVVGNDHRILKRLITISNVGLLLYDDTVKKPGGLASLTSILPDIFMKVSKTGEILELFAGDPEDLLKPREELLHTDIEQAFPAPAGEILKTSIDNAISTQTLITCNFELVFEDQVKYFDARIFTVSEDSVLAVLRNITEQIKSRQELVDANEEAKKAAKSKDDFISVMSHEIRTPLNAVIGMTQLLIRKNPSPEQLELLNTIKFSGENLLKIINEILDYSKIKAEKIEFEEIDFNLRKLVKNNRLTHRNQASEKGLKFKMFIDDDVPEWIKGDYTKLNQILNNLISNAIKFTEEGSVSLDIY
nr:PAS domain S-box protein [Bacteroidota bacterium]